jgi:16S rRNA processing protein RimM
MEILGKENLTRLGFVNKTSGFKGALSCTTDVAHPEKLLSKKFLFLILEGLPVPFAIESIDMKGDDIIVKFEDVDSEADAKKLLRKEVYTEKSRGKKKKDIFSWFDLVNFSVVDNVSGEIGIITEVLEYPMQMIAKCIHNEQEILFPLNDDIVLDIDDAEKKIFVELPDGLLDIYLK